MDDFVREKVNISGAEFKVRDKGIEEYCIETPNISV